MSKPEMGREVVEGFNQKVEQKLLEVYKGVSQLGFLSPETLSHEKTEGIEVLLGSLEREAESLSQPVMTEILGSLRVRFYSLHTVGTVDKLEKFQQEASFALQQLETVLLMMPSTSREVLESIQRERDRN